MIFSKEPVTECMPCTKNIIRIVWEIFPIDLILGPFL
jgi:hypothetical protein